MQLSEIKETLNNTLFSVGHTHIRLSSLIALVVFITVVFIALKLIRKSIYSINSIDKSKKYSLYFIIRYIIIVLAFIVSLELLGFSFSVLIAGSAALLVGLGLGIQNLFSDYISGIIILLDSTIKVDDIIEVNGMVGTVKQIHLRSTTVLLRDDKYIIIPNTDLTRHPLINWTHNHNKLVSRFEVNVNADYSSDVELVIKLLKEIAHEQPELLKNPEPFVRLNDFGDSSLKFTLYFWVKDVFRVENAKSNIRIKIINRFREHGINIPFPQIVLHKTDNPD